MLERRDRDVVPVVVADDVAIQIALEIGAEQKRPTEIRVVKIAQANVIRVHTRLEDMRPVTEGQRVGELQSAERVIVEKRFLIPATILSSKCMILSINKSGYLCGKMALISLMSMTGLTEGS